LYRIVGFDEVAAGQAQVESKRTKGKVVVRVG
jgi:hypothetical protein